MKSFLGFGLGLRTDHYQHVMDHRPAVDWFEIISENYMVAGGKPKFFLHKIREHYPMVMHGVSLSIGSSDPLDYEYLKRLKLLAHEVEPEWVSDHLCWTSLGGMNSHDLLPLPYSEPVIQYVADRISEVQDFLGRQILIENVSSYVTFKDSQYEEWEFLNAIVQRSGCRILLDINNIYVSARNHGFDPRKYIDAVSADAVQQFHLAGHSDYGDYVIDTHDHDVPDPVWELYAYALRRFGRVSTMIERDDKIPPFDDLFGEMRHARQIAESVWRQSTAESGDQYAETA